MSKTADEKILALVNPDYIKRIPFLSVGMQRASLVNILLRSIQSYTLHLRVNLVLNKLKRCQRLSTSSLSKG